MRTIRKLALIALALALVAAVWLWWNRPQPVDMTAYVPADSLVYLEVNSLPDALDAFKELDDVTPSPGVRAVGEERAWGRRLAKRFDVESKYDEKTFVIKAGGQEGFIDHVSARGPDSIDPAKRALFDTVPADRGGALIVYGWTMAEDLVKLGGR